MSLKDKYLHLLYNDYNNKLLDFYVKKKSKENITVKITININDNIDKNILTDFYNY